MNTFIELDKEVSIKFWLQKANFNLEQNGGKEKKFVNEVHFHEY